MYFKNYDESFSQGLLHLGSERITPRLNTIELLNSGTGSREGCLRNMVSNTSSISLISYFRDQDLAGLKHWAYVAAKLQIMLEYETHEKIGVESLLWPLISDNEEVIDRHCSNPMFYESVDDPHKKEQVTSHEFARLQTWRSLTRQWDALALDCERALAQPEAFNKTLRPRLVTFAFLLALARGDRSTMQSILLDKCSPKQRSKSFQYESGLTNNFIVSYATLYAKLAWRNGYELDLDTPWIPKDWLPVQPLQTYEDPWPFMQSFDIWQPLEGEWAKWSPQRKAQTP